jgi:integrase
VGCRFARSLVGGPERQVPNYVAVRAFEVSEDGIYYIGRPQPDRQHPIQFYKFSTNTSSLLTKVGGPLQQGLSVSPDRKTILFSKNASIGADLMLIENFRCISTKKRLRDRAILAVLLGCGLRRSEVAALTFGHVQQRDGRWCIVDLLGKHGRVRTVSMPTWVKVAIDAWTAAAGVTEGQVFRPVNRADQVQGAALSEKVVWQLLQPYAEAAGLGGIAPHDFEKVVRKNVPGRRGRA